MMLLRAGSVRSLLVLAGAMALGSPAVQAQAPAAPAAPPAWIKICAAVAENAEPTCSLRAEARADSGQLVATVNLQPIEDGARYSIIILTPLGARIPPGIVVAVDGQRIATAEYTVCGPMPAACIAEAATEPTIVDSLKRGGRLGLTVTVPPNRTVEIPITLIGFTSAFDGEGMSPEDAQRLISRTPDQAAAPAPTPAAPAPAAPATIPGLLAAPVAP